MNNLVFNTVSSQLRTLITNPTLTVGGEVEITNTLLNIAGEVEITNTTLTVSGEVTLTGTASVEITNTSLTVAGQVEITNTTLTVSGEVTLTGTASVEITNTSLTVEGQVEITNTTLTIEGQVEITNTSLTVAGGVGITGHEIAETNTALSNVTGTGVVFDDTDISEITTGSFFVYNTGANPFTVSLQVSPTSADSFYAFDTDNDDLPVPAGEKLIIAISKYGRYARLLYNAGGGATFSAYYIGQM
jgi:hypothetical protein